jgi:hypothetical protein
MAKIIIFQLCFFQKCNQLYTQTKLEIILQILFYNSMKKLFGGNKLVRSEFKWNICKFDVALTTLRNYHLMQYDIKQGVVKTRNAGLSRNMAE